MTNVRIRNMQNNKYVTEICPCCNGEGVTKNKFSLVENTTELCWSCRGIGKLPNEDGAAILELIKTFGGRF